MLNAPLNVQPVITTYRLTAFAVHLTLRGAFDAWWVHLALASAFNVGMCSLCWGLQCFNLKLTKSNKQMVKVTKQQDNIPKKSKSTPGAPVNVDLRFYSSESVASNLGLGFSGNSILEPDPEP